MNSLINLHRNHLNNHNYLVDSMIYLFLIYIKYISLDWRVHRLSILDYRFHRCWMRLGILLFNRICIILRYCTSHILKDRVEYIGCKKYRLNIDGCCILKIFEIHNLFYYCNLIFVLLLHSEFSKYSPISQLQA